MFYPPIFYQPTAHSQVKKCASTSRYAARAHRVCLFFEEKGITLWMEEILHQLVDGFV